MSDDNLIPPTGFTAALYVDMKRCIGCNACSLACKQENNVILGNRWTRVYGGEKGSYPEVNVQVLPMPCQQCVNAPCKNTCDALGHRAIIRRPDGILYVDPRLCVGCQQCIAVCPYKVMNFNPQKVNKLGQLGVAEKCHYCMHRLDQGLLPACVVTCLGITLEYGNYNTLRGKYSNAEPMGEIGVKVLYGNLGDEPKRPTAGHPDPVPCHDDD
ncbi:MAG: 4Fe-4S dicluster domain-containing protein [Acidobacteriota bacterium]